MNEWMNDIYEWVNDMMINLSNECYKYRFCSTFLLVKLRVLMFLRLALLTDEQTNRPTDIISYRECTSCRSISTFWFRFWFYGVEKGEIIFRCDKAPLLAVSVSWLVGRSVGWLVGRVTHSFDNLHVAPYWPTWPCYFGKMSQFMSSKLGNTGELITAASV